MEVKHSDIVNETMAALAGQFASLFAQSCAALQFKLNLYGGYNNEI